MKRPRKIYEEGGKLYILNTAGKKIYIKTTLEKNKVQKVFIKDYKKKKTKVIKQKRKITTYRNRPVLAKEIGNAVVKILKEINKGSPNEKEGPSSNDTKSSSGPTVVAESKKPEQGKDTLYMTTDERDNILLKNIEKRRLDNLLTSGIDLTPLFQAIGYESQSKNTRLENLENLAAKYIKTEVPFSVSSPLRSVEKPKKPLNFRGRPKGSKNKVKVPKSAEENLESRIPSDSEEIFFNLPIPTLTRVEKKPTEEDTIKLNQYLDRLMGLTKQTEATPPLAPVMGIPVMGTVTGKKSKYEDETWYKNYKKQNKNNSEIASELEIVLATKEKKTNKTIRSQRDFLEDYENNLLGSGLTLKLNGLTGARAPVPLSLISSSKLYPDESLYESEIKTIMKNKNAIYCPVIAKDEIDDIKVNTDKKPTFFVMNLSNRDEAGTHWVAVYIDKYDITYFDSFGKPPDKDIKQKLLEISNVSHINNPSRNLKDPLSSDCGFYSINFIENMLEGKTFAESTNLKNSNLKKDKKYYQEEIKPYEEEYV